MGVVRHPASCAIGTRDFSLGIKLPRRVADHSPPSNADVKNAWSYTFTPQYVFMAWCLAQGKLYIDMSGCILKRFNCSDLKLREFAVKFSILLLRMISWF
jgi:hypothetical protein